MRQMPNLDRQGNGPKTIQTMTFLLKQHATNAISWDTGQLSALGTKEPPGQVPSLSSGWFNRIEAACSSQPACHR